MSWPGRAPPPPSLTRAFRRPQIYLLSMSSRAAVYTPATTSVSIPIPDLSCIYPPSIVGLEPCLRELARALKPGGTVIVSDIVWRAKSDAPLGSEWRWLAATQQISADEYAAAIEGAGLHVERTVTHPRSVWE